ncbi:MAG TPA: GNAT family N-acetyltransferase [Pseudonocardia sp.]|jgi:[ribosomal protein S5]-alanine N-acetyltransferase|nr:GNAT family N-acetyltransferase [Pseudonocardia sp.]
MGQPLLSSRRLRLEPMRHDHGAGVIDVFADPASNRYFPVDLSDPEAARASVATRLAYAGPPELGHWAFVLAAAGIAPAAGGPAPGDVVGIGHLKPSVELPGEFVEMGWSINPRYGGMGLATEGVRALTRYALDEVGLPAVWALIHPANRPSLRLAERLGFHLVGTGVHYGEPHGVHVALRRHWAC